MKNTCIPAFSSLFLGLFLLTSCATYNAYVADRLPASKTKEAQLVYSYKPSYTHPMKKWFVELHDGSANKWDVGKLKTIKYYLRTPEERSQFLGKINQLLNEDQAAADKKGKKKGFLSKDARRSLELAAELTANIDDTQSSTETKDLAYAQLLEVVAAFNYDFKYPIKAERWIGSLPVELIKNLNHTAMSNKTKPAQNLIYSNKALDLSLIDPVASSFWSPAKNISKKNLYYGFDRKSLPNFVQACTYLEPKKSYGVHPGFKLQCGDKEWKFKFGHETKTEPFNTRIFWALGYPTNPVEYVPHAYVKYDRKLLTEFNSRKDLIMKVKSAVGFNYITMNLQKSHDPFDRAIRGAYLKDGSYMDTEELRKALILPAKNNELIEFGKLKDSQFNTELESRLDYIVLKEASAEAPRPNDKDLGNWSWNDYDHPDRRELRGFGVIAAYLNLFDTRTDNNKLSLTYNDKGEKQLVHYVSDLGSGFGSASNIFTRRNGRVNEYPWEFISEKLPVKRGPPHHNTLKTPSLPFNILGYKTMERNKAFENIQPEDAKWAARLLAQLTEQQLMDALIVSGWTAAEARLLFEKLTYRRQQLINVLKFDQDPAFKEIRLRSFDKKFNYDPQTDGIPQAQGSKEKVKAKDDGSKIIDGVWTAQ